MKALLCKELRLAAHPTLYLFGLLGALVLVPAYPYGMVFLFGCMGVYFTFLNARENKDAFYTAVLPVRKRDAVRARLLLVVLFELSQLALSVPFAWLRLKLLPGGNPAGIEANCAYYGVGLLVYAGFNLLFFSSFYKTAVQAGKAFLFAMIPAALLVSLMEAAVHIPALAWLDSTNAAEQVRQLPILLIGIAAYAGGAVLTDRIACARYERVDL